MPLPSVVSVWSRWRLHADAVVSVLTDHEIAAEVAGDPWGVPGVLVAELVAGEDLRLLTGRRREGRPTVVWGGTLPVPRVAALRDAGASAYVTGLDSPQELAAVVRRVQEGQRPTWSAGAAPTVTLTPRERQVAQAYLVLWADRTRAKVAAQLGIS
ncbi:hypothetical protein [Janibacter limosus]|uniref:hypothetical protein n=1 Tax=Janibacter limosus TaxID=53458 RepID=UPI000AF5977E|nr:hypothetical protein [Janibacter limosus]